MNIYKTRSKPKKHIQKWPSKHSRRINWAYNTNPLWTLMNNCDCRRKVTVDNIKNRRKHDPSRRTHSGQRRWLIGFVWIFIVLFRNWIVSTQSCATLFDTGCKILRLEGRSRESCREELIKEFYWSELMSVCWDFFHVTSIGVQICIFLR